MNSKDFHSRLWYSTFRDESHPSFTCVWKSLSCVRLLVTPGSPWDSPGQNTGVGSRSLLLGIFLIQGSNPGLPCCRQILYQLNHHQGGRSFTYSCSYYFLFFPWVLLIAMLFLGVGLFLFILQQSQCSPSVWNLIAFLHSAKFSLISLASSLSTALSHWSSYEMCWTFSLHCLPCLLTSYWYFLNFYLSVLCSMWFNQTYML